MHSPSHYVSIEHYGSQRVTFAGQTVSAFKIGYSTVGKAVLLHLYGSAARDVTSRHASYHYVEITGTTCSHQGYLVLVLNDAEFAQVQQITRPHLTRRSGLWYWQERQWRHFPYAETIEFTLPLGRGGPTFDPTRLWVVSPAQNTPVEATEGIHADYVQRSPDEDGWWWLSGNTYPHRELLKQQGLRWSAKRQQWYLAGAKLPVAVQALLTATPEPAPLEEDAPCSDEEAERILGVKLAPKPEALKPPEHRFALGQMVYLATSLRVAKDKKLKMDTCGKVIRRYAFQQTPDYRHQFAYGVDFGEQGVVTLFQDSLADAPYNIPGIERHETIPIMFGVSAEQGILAEVERRQRIPQDYAVLDELPPPMNELPPLPELPPSDLNPALPSPENLPNLLPTLSTPKKPKIEPQYHPTPRFTPTQTYILPQTYIGQIGSAVGTVFAFGAATWEYQPIYLDIAGGNAAIQSVWARLADGQAVHIVPLETGGANILLQPKAKGTLKPLRKKLALGLDHLLLLHHDLVEPIYGETSATYLIELDEGQLIRKLAAQVTQLVQIAVFESYHRYLWEVGQTQKLIQRGVCQGEVRVWHLTLDLEAWTALICDGLKDGKLQLPQESEV